MILAKLYWEEKWEEVRTKSVLYRELRRINLPAPRDTQEQGPGGRSRLQECADPIEGIG
jgi:hypothetical protein